MQLITNFEYTSRKFQQLEVAKMTTLKTVVVFDVEKELVKDKVRELGTHYYIAFETTVGLVAQLF